VIALLLAAQLAAASPCPASLTCPVPLLAVPRRVIAPQVAPVANPEQPAKWFIAGNLVALGAFETWALDSQHDTVSQFAQRESAHHPAVRWTIVTGMALLTWHLAWGFPW
jgi:hypothetical protein